jgi:hypothetical protein
MLVFLSGVFEITTVADALAAYAAQTNKWIVLLLHSGLPVEEQDRVFATSPPGIRKCIVSTNIGEPRVDALPLRIVAVDAPHADLAGDRAVVQPRRV